MIWVIGAGGVHTSIVASSGRLGGSSCWIMC